MGSALVGFASGDSSFATGSFGTIGNGGVSATASAEVDAQLSVRVAGTFSKLGVLVDATGTGRVIRFRKNGANGNQSVSPTDTTAGFYEDGTNSDAVTTADLVDFSVTTSTGSPVIRTLRTVFTATSNHACFYMTTGGGLTVNFDSATRFISFGGVTAGVAQTTEANAQSLLRVGGTLQNFQCVVSNNGRSTATTFKNRINGADGTCTVSVSAGATGRFEDTTHTDTVAAGDLLGYAVVAGGPDGSSLRMQQIASAIVVTSGSQNDVFATSGSGATRDASGTATYYTLIGNISGSTTEANRAIQHAFSGSASRLRLYLSANTYSTDGTATFRVAAADGTQTVALTAGATGWFEDTTHSDGFASADNCCVKIVGGTSGSITLRCIGTTESNVTAYNQSAQATTSPAASLTRQTGKPLQATTTPTTSLTALRVVLSSIQALAAQATSLTRQTGAARQATTSPTTVIAHAIAAARQATTTPAASRTSQTTKTGQTATTPPASATRATGKPVQSLSVPTASTIRATGKAAQASATRAASLARSTGKAAQGSTTPTKSLSRLTAAVRQASTAPTGRFTAALTKALQALASVIATNPISYALTLRATALAVGTIASAHVWIGKTARAIATFTGRTAATDTSGFVGKSSAEATAFTGKTSAQS